MKQDKDPFEIKVWAQMFFDDGSVSQGVRISADIYDDDRIIEETYKMLLKSVNRTEGFLLIWGAGDIRYGSFTSSSASELGFSASSPESV